MDQRTIARSVGFGCANQSADVTQVQKMLLAHGFRIGTSDGICGPRTIGAIRAFQASFLRVPDGRVDPHGITWQRLTEGAREIGVRGIHSRYTHLVPKPAPGTVNIGLEAANNAFMESKLGKPRDHYSSDCQPLTNEKLKRNTVIRNVGKFNVQGLAPAVASLSEVLADIAREQPDIHTILGTAGMLCCRFQRGSSRSISNHSWGTAIDITLNGLLDVRGDNKTQFGLTLIAPIFNRHGWYWGATFRTEDSMHFEASQRLISVWAPQLH